jgi:hypothetical protein
VAETRVELTKDRFPEIIAELPVKCAQDEANIANEIAQDAARRAPRGRARRGSDWGTRRTGGYLADSIEVEEVPTGETSVNVWAFYGVFVEKGTVDTAAEPYLFPAAVANEPELINAVRKTLRRL